MLTTPVLLLDTSAWGGHSKWQALITLSVRVISWDSKEISWNRIENSTKRSKQLNRKIIDVNHLRLLLDTSAWSGHSKWQALITLSVRVISRDSKEISWNRIENSTRPNYSLLNPSLTSRYIRLRLTLEVTGRELEKTKRLLDTSAWSGHSKWQGENSTSQNHFSIRFSIENHSKW
jgi:hypothetical protein